MDVLDCGAWKAMLDREGLDVAGAGIGVLARDDFAARRGSLLVWRGTDEGAAVGVRGYDGAFDDDLAVLLVADAAVLQALLADGLAQVAPLVRCGKLDPYVLMTLDELDDVGLADFVEDLGLVFPRH